MNLLTLNKTPQRIISLVPSQTELLVDLGLENSIVGVTKFCIHPVGLKAEKTIVGGTKNINIETIKALNPDIILCNKEENTKEIVEECSKIAATHVSDIFTIDDNLDLIKIYGEIFECDIKSNELITKIKNKRDLFLRFIDKKPKLKTAYFIWKKPWMVAAKKTYINHLLELNNYDNIYKDKDRYPEIDINKIKTDLIFLSSEPFPFMDKHIKELNQIAPSSKTIIVDGEMFSWYGSRIILAFNYFIKLRNSL